jgi:hypothetical protein
MSRDIRLTLIAVGICLQSAGGLRADDQAFSKQVAPFLSKHCIHCHGGKKPKADLRFDSFSDQLSALKDRTVWTRVLQALNNHEMPPHGRVQPGDAEVRNVVQWIDSVLAVKDCMGSADPGRVTIRRLNRTEYNNTIRDLVGIDFHPAEDFPADDVGNGFDNNGDVLSLPPLLMEKYLAASEQIVSRAFDSPTVRSRIVFCHPDAKNEQDCARKILERFARHAYRRSVSQGEVDRLAGFVKLAKNQGDDFETGIRLALQAVLTSPNFLFRVERDPRPLGKIHSINDFELATRLSYFLWSSMPDDELLKLAEKKTLHEPGILESQVRRMLADTKSAELVVNFAGQWLQTRNLSNASPDAEQFPDFDEPLRHAMLKETELFFKSILGENRSILEFVDSDYSFMNERLAKFYGIAGVKGDDFRKVSLAKGPRGGVLCQASILTLTSNPTRTSPVKRGKWILENFLGAPPPPPPPNAGDLSEDKDVVLSGSLRKRMEQHRANPNCVSCHQRMDPLGFGLENFDAVGKWREKDGAFPIDASGTLPGGRTFAGPTQLKGILKEKAPQFCRCLTEKMLTYALGRGMEPYDKCAMDRISDAVAADKYHFQTLVIEVVKSDPFQRRRAKGDS